MRAHNAMHNPRTRVGKISEHRMFGIIPSPITKQHWYTTTLKVEMIAFRTEPKLTTLAIISKMSDTIRTGIVESNSDLGKEDHPFVNIKIQNESRSPEHLSLCHNETFLVHLKVNLHTT